MPAAPDSAQSFGLVVQPTGKFRLLPWTPTITPQHALRCDLASPIGLTTRLTAWHDTYAAYLGQDVNVPAFSLLSMYVNCLPHRGDVVVTAGIDTTGRTLGLGLDQALTVLGRLLDRPRTVPRQPCR